MSKKRKFISMIVVVVIAISQLFVLVQGASYLPYWNVEMPNWQTQVVLGSGEKGNPDHQYTQISCTGGTVNKIQRSHSLQTVRTYRRTGLRSKKM